MIGVSSLVYIHRLRIRADVGRVVGPGLWLQVHDHVFSPPRTQIMHQLCSRVVWYVAREKESNGQSL
jgi:hypothetical protein